MDRNLDLLGSLSPQTVTARDRVAHFDPVGITLEAFFYSEVSFSAI